MNVKSNKNSEKNAKNVEIVGSKAKTLVEFLKAHSSACDGMRLGQRFVNIYISQPWPELFYQESNKEALRVIENWLIEYQYFNTMPPLAKKR